MVRVPLTERERVLRQLRADGRVRYAEPNYVVSLDATPNDQFYGELWALNNTGQSGGTADADIDAPEAWNITTGSTNVIVGVIDTGVNYTHADLVANMWVNPGEIAANDVDDDGNGYIDDVHGINAITGTGNPMDDHSHGTHVAGTIGAKGNNLLGVIGVNWNVRIAVCKMMNSSGQGNTSDAVECFQYFNKLRKVYGQNVLVANNSWGGTGFSQALSDAMAGGRSARDAADSARGRRGERRPQQ